MLFPTKKFAIAMCFTIFTTSPCTKMTLIFFGNQHALEVAIYHDNLEVCNPLGIKAGKHKVNTFYYSLINTDPKFRSKHCNLLTIYNTKFVKKYCMEKVPSPIVDDINRLYEGYTMLIQKRESNVFGKLLMYLGDTLGQHSWGGFKEGTGVSRQTCRHCYCEFDDLKCLFQEEYLWQETKNFINNIARKSRMLKQR